MIELMNIKDKEEYYRKLNVRISMSKMWNSLQAKSEMGLGKNEMGYQLVSKVMAGNIARGLGLHVDLAECLAMCHGSFFPAYGKSGKRIVLQYMKENRIEISEADLARNFVEYDLHRTGNIISIDFNQKLQELFTCDRAPETCEVALAKFCWKTIECIKEIEANSNIEQTDFLYTTVRSVVNDCIESGKLVEREGLQEHLLDIEEREFTLGENKRTEIFSRIKSLSKLFKSEKMAGIYEFIGASESLD